MAKHTQSRALTSRQLRSLRELATLDGVWSASPTSAGSFLERYVAAEAVARRLITLKSGKACPHTLNFTSIQSAVRLFPYSLKISPNLVEAIFHSGDIRAGKVSSPRQLRNAIIHGLSSTAIIEVETEYKKLMLLMQRWLDVFLEC